MIELVEIETPEIEQFLKHEKSIEEMDIEELFAKAVNYYTSVQRFDVAYCLFKKVVEREPDYVHEAARDNAYFYLGQIYFRYGMSDNLEDVLELYSKALEMKPDDGEAYLYRGSVFKELGEYEKAIDDFEQALKHDKYNFKEIIEEEIINAKEALETKT